VVTYYLVVYSVSYALVGGFFFAGGSFEHPSWVLFAQLSALTPALAALALTRWLWREPLVATLGLRPRLDRWLLVAVAPLAGGSELTVGMSSLSWIGADLLLVCALLAYDRFLAPVPIAWRAR
jgi:hypothetical protein